MALSLRVHVLCEHDSRQAQYWRCEQDNHQRAKKTRHGLHDSGKELSRCIRHLRSQNVVVWYSWWSPVTGWWLQGESTCRSSVRKELCWVHTHGTMSSHFWDICGCSVPAMIVSVAVGWLMGSRVSMAIKQNQQNPLLPSCLLLSPHSGKDKCCAECLIAEHSLRVSKRSKHLLHRRVLIIVSDMLRHRIASYGLFLHSRANAKIDVSEETDRYKWYIVICGIVISGLQYRPRTNCEVETRQGSAVWCLILKRSLRQVFLRTLRRFRQWN